jgi:RNA polymerase subunit RPABC4/transcription elongation factor Spt4
MGIEYQKEWVKFMLVLGSEFSRFYSKMEISFPD